jgi:hypothetical protein
MQRISWDPKSAMGMAKLVLISYKPWGNPHPKSSLLRLSLAWSKLYDTRVYLRCIIGSPIFVHAQDV